MVMSDNKDTNRNNKKPMALQGNSMKQQLNDDISEESSEDDEISEY